MTSVTKLATHPSNFRRPALFYASAREGMHDFLRSYPGAAAPGVLLPSFVGRSPREGSGVFDPVSSLGLRAEFYGLEDDLTVDVAQVAELAAGGDYQVLVVIHYFGRAEQRMPELRAIADAHGMVLVEDLAHGFFTAMRGGPAGVHGDVSLHSLHKLFPMPAGGMVTYADERLLNGQRSTMPGLAVELLSYDWHGISERRRQNFTGLTERLRALPVAGTAFRLLWPVLHENDVPQTLPVYIEGTGRDELYTTMNAQGFGVVSLYHTLVSEVEARHPRSVDLSRHITNLPCHQDMDEGDLDGLVEAFDRALVAR